MRNIPDHYRTRLEAINAAVDNGDNKLAIAIIDAIAADGADGRAAADEIWAEVRHRAGQVAA